MSLALLAACSSGESGERESGIGAGSDSSVAAADRTRSADPSGADPSGADAPGADPSGVEPRLARPAASSGPLNAKSVPAPEALGPGWATFIDPGAAAEGYVGNGSFVRERAGDALVASLIPLGCTDVAANPTLPRPQHALEATYRHADGSAAVVIVLDFPDEDTARRLLRELGAVISSCPAAADDLAQSPYRPVIEVTQSDDNVLLDTRREAGQDASAAQWMEVAVREEQRVALAVVEARPSAPGPDMGRLSKSLREAVRGR